MKKLSYSVFIGVFLMLISCEKNILEPLFAGGPYIGSATAKKNDTEWNPKIRVVKYRDNDNLSISFVGFHPDTNFKEESMTIKQVNPKQKRRVKLSLLDHSSDLGYQSTYSTITGHGDTKGDRYILDTLADNWIEIESFDTSFQSITGRFSASFYFVEILPNGSEFIETISFTSGSFQADIQ